MHFKAAHIDSVELNLTARLDQLDRIAEQLRETEDEMDWSSDDSESDEEYEVRLKLLIFFILKHVILQYY